MKNLSVYITFALVAIGMAGFLISIWGILFDRSTEEGQHKANLWSGHFLVIGLFFVFIGIMAYFITGAYTYFPAVIHGLGVGMLLTTFTVGSVSLGGGARGQSAFFGGVSVLLILVVFGLLFATNYLLGFRHTKKFDFNLNKLESLSDETTKVLKELKVPVKVVGFLYDEEKHLEPRLRNVLDRYRAQNRDKFTYQIVNPMKAPQMAECYGVKDSGGKKVGTRVVVGSGSCKKEKKKYIFKGKKMLLQNLSEKDLTNKLIKVTRQDQKEICFLTGRQQPRIDGDQAKTRFGYSVFKSALEDKGYKTRSFDLITQQEVPKTCSVVVNAAPEVVLLRRQGLNSDAVRLSPTEVQRLSAYLNKGGKMLVFQEPLVKSGLEETLGLYGVTTQPGLIVDFAANHGQNPLAPYGLDFDRGHKITKGFYRRVRLLYNWATPIEIATARPKGVSLTSLVKTVRVDLSRMMLGAKANPCCSFTINDPADEGFRKILGYSRGLKQQTFLMNIARGLVGKLIKDSKQGPFSMAVAASKKVGSDETRIVVVGDSAFASNVLFRFNNAFIMNAIAWLSLEKDLVHIPERRRKPSRIFLTESQRKFINYTTVYGMPGFFLFIIFFVMMVRRQS